MKIRKEINEVLLDIKNEIPEFNKQDLLEYTKWAIQKIYDSLKVKQEIGVKCKDELIKKLKTESLKYRITENIDRISIQYVELFDTVKRNNEFYIQIYSSVYFYDDVKNNINDNSEKDKYWNDIWIVTVREGVKSGIRNSNCANCGAIMEYNKIEDVFQCKYCGNVVHNKSNSIWEIVDIEVNV